MRRAAITTALVGVLAAASARAQTPPTFRTNFAIPDAPAFELLSVQPGTILRPQTPRDLALAFSNFLSADGGFTVPRAVAIEFSPGLLAHGDRMTQAMFDRRRGWNSLRLSLAALRAETGNGPSRLALGVRYSLIDEAGVGTDRDFAPEFQTQPAIDSIHTIREQARRRAVEAAPADVRPNQVIAVLDPGERAAVEDLSQRIRRIWAERYWNVTRWDFAFAMRARSADSVGHDPKLDALSAWSTYALGVHTWGQLLLGVRAGSSRDSVSGVMYGDGSVSTRFYAGTNRAKAFIEGQLSGRVHHEPAAFANSGFEFAVADWIWLEFHAGVERLPGGGSRLSTGFKLKTALPGK